MWIRSTILLISFSFLFTGCCINRERINLTLFPPEPENKEYSIGPVLEYNKTNKTYIITEDFMQESLQNIIFLNEIRKWRTDNGIR